MLSVASHGTYAFTQQGHIRAVVTHRYREGAALFGCISQRLSRPCILKVPCFYLTVLICISRCCVYYTPALGNITLVLRHQFPSYDP